MPVLIFHDLDGDLVAIDSAAIIAIRAGRVERDADILTDVTLISLPNCTVAVREPTDEVIRAWSGARDPDSRAGSVYPDAKGWLFPDVVMRSRG